MKYYRTLLLFLALALLSLAVFGCAESKPANEGGERVVATMTLPNGQTMPLTHDQLYGDEPIVLPPTSTRQAVEQELDQAKSRAKLWLQQL
jgi:hypothetical protein